jgi:probable phosphoglycerate mutase
MECDYGDYEGKTTAAIRETQPGWNVFHQGCPHGESVEQIAQRADRVVAALRPLDGTVGVFSHGHFLRALAVRWLGLPMVAGRHFALDTASISILGHDPHSASNPVISVWNSRA